MGIKFKDIKVGQTAKVVHKISESDIQKFVELSGDDNRLHIDASFAAKTSFKKPVVHGMLGVAFISTVIGTKLPGDGALWISQSLEFLLPVRVGDEITVSVKVLCKYERDQSIELKTDVVNQNKQVVTKGTAKVRMITSKAPVRIEASTQCDDRRVALVIGGAGGVGSSVCRKLAGDGYNIAVHYNRGLDIARSLAKELGEIDACQSFAFGADIMDLASVKSMISDVKSRLGGIDALVVCVSKPLAPIEFRDLIWEDFDAHLGIQVRGLFNVTSSVVPLMEQKKYGKIILINSMMLESPASKFLPYTTAKGALMGFFRALALDLAPKGIRVNSVSPGMTDTKLINDFPDRVKLTTAAKTPLKRLACPDDIAEAVVYLASNRSDFLCGETIRVNGGQVMI